jgi:hypothetical protein
MKKIMHIALKVLLSLLLIMPIFGILGFFPAPTPDMYTNATAFRFIQILMASKYIMFLEGLTFVVSLVLLWTRREALTALLLLPFTVNIVGFHMFLDGGLFTSGAIMGNVFLVLNLYFLCTNKKQLAILLQKTSVQSA